MIEKIQLKIATIEDLSALEKAGDSLFDFPIKPDRAKEFLNDPRHHLAIAYYENKVVGMASAFHYVHPDKDPSLFINEVGVVDAFQNNKIGRKLVKYLCNYGKKIGCYEAWVATENSNKAARKAYVAAGGIKDDDSIVMYTFDTHKY